MSRERRRRARESVGEAHTPPAGPAPPSEEYREDCPCPKVKCPRHKRCRECTAHHARRGRQPYCLR